MGPLRHIAFTSSLRRRLLLLTAAVSLVVAACNVVVLASGRSTTATAERAPRADAALLLSTEVESRDRPSAMLADRISAAAELWQAGRVRRILVTGDETLRGQVSVTARELGRLGVPEHALVLDHFGIDTWDSVLRARDVFRVRSIVAVTQRFHCRERCGWPIGPVCKPRDCRPTARTAGGTDGMRPAQQRTVSTIF